MNSDQSSAATDVAVIGMAVRLPEAGDVTQFRGNLRAGRDSVREPSAERKVRTSLPLEDRYQLGGYIEDIDAFDHAFFGISKGEADNMAPQHRMLLETAYHAVENAGCDPTALRGQRGSVYLGDTKVLYDELAARPEATMVMGSHVSAMAGRLSRLFGLRGPAAMIDSSCSSSLVALHLACNDLLLDDATVALVGGASLNIFADRLTGELDIGIRSPDGKTRCFSAEAAGTGSGEAVVVLVLKRLDHALAAGDPIRAVIKGVAVNNVGGRSSTLTAPDSEAEAEVIQRAWAKAGVDPRTISYIEAHGTATRLGDPIEIEAIDTAFATVTDDRGFCALSSVKSNVGHTWSAAGLVGMVKAVLSIENAELYPNLHSETLSPLIDFANSAVVVTRELTPWLPDCVVRRAGVSSFGVMGTNAHAILEQAPVVAAPNPQTPEDLWFPVSAKSAESLRGNLSALREWLDAHPTVPLADVQRTLVAGRSHHALRFSTVAADRNALDAALAAGPATSGDEVVEGLVLVLSERCTATPELTSRMRAEQPVFDALYRDCELAAEDSSDVRAQAFAFQYAFVGLLRHLGIAFGQVVSDGTGKLALAASRGTENLAQALRKACDDSRVEGGGNANASGDLDARVDRLLARFEGRRVLFLEAGPLSTISTALAARELIDQRVIAVGDAGLPGVLQEFYRGGLNWTWADGAGSGRRIELPGYRFDRTRCWLTDVRVADSSAPADDVQGADGIEAGDPLPAVLDVWCDVLGMQECQPDESFFALGGDSISALEVIDALTKRFGVELDDFVVIDHDTARSLAQHIEKLRPAETATVPRADDDEPFPASPAQQQVWLAAQFEGGSVAFNLARSYRLDGPVDELALDRAATALLRRHEALRTAYVLEDGRLMQRVLPVATRGSLLQTVICDGPMPGAVELGRGCEPFAATEFDLSSGQLLALQLRRFGDERSVLTLRTHHVAVDGWSLDVLIRDLAQLYAAEVTGGEQVLSEPASYRAHAEREQSRVAQHGAAAEAYWLQRFADVPPPLDLPARRDDSPTAFRGAYLTYLLSPESWERIRQYSRSEGGTAFTCLLSLFAALFAQYSERGELVLGTSVAGRTSSDADLVGMLVRTLPMRAKVERKTTFGELYAAIRNDFRDGLAHSAYLYEQLVTALNERGVTSVADLFTVLVEYEQFADDGVPPHEPMTRAGLSVEPLETTLATSVFPMNVMLSEHHDGSLAAVIRYDTDLFNEATVHRLWSGFADVADILIGAPTRPIVELPLLGPAEEQRVRTLGYRGLPLNVADTVPAVVARFAIDQPARVCLSGPDGTRTNAELDARANRLARHLQSEGGVRPGDLVALVMDRSITLVETILAVWRCGAAYLPIDPAHPAPFVAMMVKTSGARAIAYDPRQATPDVVTCVADGLSVLEILPGTAADLPSSPLGVDIDPDGLAYVIYTSGSTGAPKGAMVAHRGMLNHLHAKIEDLELDHGSVVVANAPSSFDISLWQMFAASFAGGRSVIYDQSLQLDPVRMAARMVSDGITVLEVVPSYLDTLLDAWGHRAGEVELPRLRHLMVTGEAVRPQLVNRWLAAFPGIPVVNAYGPTEASDDITHHIMVEQVDDRRRVPIGRPIPNTHLYLLDEHSRVVPEGVKGEICASGICVGPGYRGDPEETARVFSADPFDPDRRLYRTGDLGRWRADGTLDFLGRSDSQVKVRGYRVDLGEIETRAAQAPGVAAVAVVVPNGTRDRLCGYVVLADGGALAACRAYLSAELPSYMVPADLVELAALPLTPNGKVDRVALRAWALGTRQTLSRAPRSRGEGALQAIWQGVLGRPVGIDERFFDVGGNSLRAIQVLARTRSQLGAELRLEQLFLHPTIAALAELLPDAGRAHDDAVPTLGAAGTYEVAPQQRLLLHIEEVAEQRDAFARNDFYSVSGTVDADLFRRAFEEVVRRHESLRTTFAIEAGDPRQIVHLPGELPLAFAVRHLRDAGAVTEFVHERIRTPFDISTQPLVRADLLRTDDQVWMLLISMHQLVSDGQSAQVLHDELVVSYDRLAAGEPPQLSSEVMQYKDVAAWRASQLSAQRVGDLRRFWHASLAGASPSVALSTDRPRPAMSALDGDRLYLRFDDELRRAITALAAQCSVTEFVVAHTALTLLLCAETGTEDVTVGTYTRGRNRTEFENGIGCYINTVPLRFRLTREQSVRALLRTVQDSVLQAFAHEDQPYEWTLRELGWQRGVDRTPLFDVMIAMDEWEQDAADAHALEMKSLELPRRAKEGDLLVVFQRGEDQLDLAVTYDTHLFDASRVRAWMVALREVLAGMVAERTVDEIVGRP